MASRTGTAHVVTTKRKYKDQVYCTHLLRRSYREDGLVKNETLGNLSHLPDQGKFVLGDSGSGDMGGGVFGHAQIVEDHAGF